MSVQAIKQFIESNQWQRADNYSGEDLTGFIVVPGIAQNRDSGILDQSNFQAALEQLGGESESVQVQRFGSWLCGWFEIITVNPADSTAVSKAMAIDESLKDYALLDESDYMDREAEYIQESFHDYQEQFCAAVLEFCGFKQDGDEWESLIDDKDVILVASALYSDACGYFGTEDAFLSVNNLDQVAETYNLSNMAIQGNACAELVCAILDVEAVSRG